ncbi:MAG: response regulator transcription factor [Oceanospirillaceae bacterium]|nr:response regulator transcription factor [Oceanospirillaceae bacterium]
MKLLLADDHGLFRDSIALWLQQLDKNVEILFASDLLSTQQAIAEQQFDLIILDLYMPDMQGAISVKKICEGLGSTPVIIVSAEEDPRVIQQCINAGVKGYVPKSAQGTTILKAIKQVVEGGVYLPNTLQGAVGHGPNMQVQLNDKQLQILAFIVQGKSNKEIGEGMFLSEGTIKQYVTKLLRILDVDNRVQASHKGAEILGINRAGGGR